MSDNVIEFDGSEHLEEETTQLDVKFLTSLALAVPTDDEVKHLQITICQETESKKIRCFFDVIDPTKLPKFAEDE